MSNEKFKQGIKNATDQIIENLTQSMNKACLFLEGEAKKNININTGILAASMGTLSTRYKSQ